MLADAISAFVPVVFIFGVVPSVSSIILTIIHRLIRRNTKVRNVNNRANMQIREW